MNYVLAGMNHKTAPVAMREKVAFGKGDQSRALARLLNTPAIQEAVILSTCNRVEIYSSTKEIGEAKKILLETMLSGCNTEDHHTLKNHVYFRENECAVLHLFEVAASLDSQITGENQITAQVKEAHLVAHQNSATGYYLNNLFSRALFVAKRVKTETDISRGNVSVGSVGAMLAQKIFGSLKDKSVLLLGAGETGELVIRHLNSLHPKETMIVNRTFDKALKLQAEGLGTAYEFEELGRLLCDADVLISSVSGVLTQLSRDAICTVMNERYQQPLFIIDLGVPRTIPAEVSGIDNLYLYNIDDLHEIAGENKAARSLSAEEAKNIIDQEARLFYEKHINFLALPAIAGLGKKFEAIRAHEFKRTVSKMPLLSHEDIARIEKLTHSIINKILHDPVLSLKNQKELSEPYVIGIFRKLFRLDDEGSE
ncbi:MAG: glutamyl-tRNA reductase [Deltaproteobacteria bacterium]|nr:glutamyl-tRNA reductase [Deltaproteobacteria bacterium]